MSRQLEFKSPGLVDLGPNLALSHALERVSSQMVELADDTSNTMYYSGRLSDSTTHFELPMHLALQEAIAEIREAKPDAVYMSLRRMMQDAQLFQPLHTDTQTGDGVLDADGRWRFEIGPVSKPIMLMCLDGDTTRVADGSVYEDVDNIRALPGFSLPGGSYSGHPSGREVNDRLAELRSDLSLTYTGAVGQLIALASGNGTGPKGEYDIVSPPEGNLFELDPLAIHQAPSHLTAGRLLLHVI